MGIARSHDETDLLNAKGKGERILNSVDFYCAAIENAEGVPFQLIFGPQPGEGYYLNIGKGIKNLLGVSPEEFTEKIFLGMIEKIIPLDKNTSSDLSASREKLINNEITSYKAEVLVRFPGGDKKWIQDSSLPLIDNETGKVIGAFGILFDINDRKQNLINLEQAKEKAEESDRLKSAFLHNISHEIRTPLNAIVGFSALLDYVHDDLQKSQEYVDIINKSADNLLEVVDNVVEISNIEADNVTLSLDEINLNARLEMVFERFRNQAVEKRIVLDIKVPSDFDGTKIRTDGYKLSRVLANLIGNAIKFTKHGKVEFGYSHKGDKLEFYVSDTGIGIPEEYHVNIFSRFYQVDSSNTRLFGGTGLGLSISSAYVRMLGGEIWFNSRPGIGSEFYFTLPYEKA